ncbi:MAG: DUF3147 family protein [Chloroflexi bacterium]|nr:MAG: DUF3147 family protein [Chloroflexota bacterium]
MKDFLLLAVRVLAGGCLVVAFAMLSDMLKPKMFSGLFGGAPSVATASLLVSGLAMGPAKDEKYGTGMIAGAIGLVAYSLAAALAVKHLGAVAGSIVAWIAWVVPAAALYWFFLR